jgi:tRNA-modifying protein YgfZ
MNSNWQESLGAFGARIDNGVVTDFGDLASELVSARDETIISPLTHLGLIECAGDDAKIFLHNQLTSDINHLDPGSAQHSAWCTAKGRMLATFVLYRNESDYRALLSLDLLTAIQKRLQMYVLRSKVKITDQSGSHELIGLSGPQTELVLQSAALPVPAKVLETAAFSNGTVIRLDNKRLVIIVSHDAASGLWKSLSSNARPVGTQVWQWLDIQAGIPLIAEATKEAFVPQMADFDKIGGVSFHKGCYPGQEVVARAQYLGKIKRHLYRLHTSDAVTAGTAIYVRETPEHPCGMVANAAPAPGGGYDALAVVQEEFVEVDKLRLGLSGNQAPEITGIILVNN